MWPDQLVGSQEMEDAAPRAPVQRITKRSSNHLMVQHCCQQTEMDCFGRERDGRIRILKKLDPARRTGNLKTFSDCCQKTERDCSGREKDGRIRIGI